MFCMYVNIFENFLPNKVNFTVRFSIRWKSESLLKRERNVKIFKFDVMAKQRSDPYPE